MGSQGDAGQFRTPRHIIDFLVAIVDPQKDDTILDPACGTAGFLISAFKHIKDKNNQNLTPAERKRLIQNFTGYDISPDMVRLSLVNLYLHGFSDPHIYEYDTLSSEERWKENFDVILANPPFMSPKGGIRPHKKFSIDSNRSEVLFVDYIAEHLNPNGRAGVIVPEGVIFQSGTAYKALRKMLVENYLYAVVSLPPGIFKTSILLMDREMAKKSKEVLFVRIDNDGFNLGAQRSAIKGGQLGEAIKIIHDFNSNRKHPASGLSHAVRKSEIAKSGDYNLSGERYKKSKDMLSSFPKRKIAEVCILNPLKSELQGLSKDTVVSFVPMSDLNENSISFEIKHSKTIEEVYNGYTYFRNDDVLIAKVTPCFENGKAGLANNLHNGIGFGSSEYYVLRAKDNILPKYLYHAITKSNFKDQAIPQMTGTGGLRRVPKNVVSEFSIPVPPLAIQEEIVAEIEVYQKIIDGAKMVVENYKPKIEIDPEWEMVELNEIIDDLETGVSVNSENKSIQNGGYGVLKTSAVTYGIFNPNENKAILSTELKRAKCTPLQNSIIISRMNTEAFVGASAYVDRDYPNLFLPDRLWQTIITRKDIYIKFLFLILSSPEYRKKISDLCAGTSGSMKNISKKNFLQLTVPLPPISIQEEIANQIEAQQSLVDANKRLIEIFEQKINYKIGSVWGDKVNESS